MVCYLFVIRVMYYFISKLPDIWNLILSIIFACVGWWMLDNNLDFDFTKLPWNVECACSGLLFFSLGNLYVKYVKPDSIPKFTIAHKVYSFGMVVVLTVLLWICSYYNGHVTLGSNVLGGSVFLFYLLGLCGTTLTLLFSSIIEQLLTSTQILKRAL